MNRTPQGIIAEFNREHGHSGDDVLFVKKLRSLALNDEQIAAVIVALETTCSVCFDGRSDCQCWNDE